MQVKERVVDTVTHCSGAVCIGSAIADTMYNLTITEWCAIGGFVVSVISAVYSAYIKRKKFKIYERNSKL